MFGADSLRDSEVLVLDCQATGAGPAHGFLLELGWAVLDSASSEPPEVTARLLKPRGRIPRQITRITGLERQHFTDSIPAARAWQQLMDDARRVARPDSATPTVIHFARYELAFLEALHRDSPFPLRVFCTHAIARRVLPTLPRRSLRALAGYFGFSVHRLRRSAEHVAATAFVWRNLTELLEREHGVRTFEELGLYLEGKPPRPAKRRVYPMPRLQRLCVADEPGVYRMLRSNGDVIYVGKARSLKKRVNSYFRKHRKVPERTLEMLSQARELSVTTTPTALEAALLESDEIKALEPPYNVALQERERKLWFSDADLLGIEPRADADHRIGPLVSPDQLAALRALGGLIGGRDVDAAATSRALGVPSAYGPDGAACRAGVSLFRTRHEDRLRERRSVIHRLRRIDAHLSVPDEPEDDRESTWDPQRVASTLEEQAAFWALRLRRARWLCLLTESCIAFRESASGPRRLLVIESGQIVTRATLDPTDALVAPRHAAATLEQRQRTFDLASCDRLRVLTTELRRVCVEGEVDIRLGNRARLDKARLARVLPWV